MEFQSWQEVDLELRRRSGQVMDHFTTDILVTVRARTPIKTGFARSRWIKDPVGSGEWGQTWIIGNDCDYILPLEYGHSKQAPNGMARITAAESQARLDNAVLLVVGG